MDYSALLVSLPAMAPCSSLAFAVLLITAVFAIDPTYHIPGPTRTPNADHEADKAHHKALRAWDRERQAYFRSLLQNGSPIPAASTAPVPSSDPGESPVPTQMSPHEFDKLWQAYIRNLDRVYHQELRAWDRRRQQAYRDGVEVFPEPSPEQPDYAEMAKQHFSTGIPTSSISPPEVSAASRVLEW